MTEVTPRGGRISDPLLRPPRGADISIRRGCLRANSIPLREKCLTRSATINRVNPGRDGRQKSRARWNKRPPRLRLSYRGLGSFRGPAGPPRPPMIRTCDATRAVTRRAGSSSDHPARRRAWSGRRNGGGGDWQPGLRFAGRSSPSGARARAPGRRPAGSRSPCPLGAEQGRERYGAAAHQPKRRRLTSGPSWRPAVAVAVAGIVVICAAVVIGVVGTRRQQQPDYSRRGWTRVRALDGTCAGASDRTAARRPLRRRDVPELREVLRPAHGYPNRPHRRPPALTVLYRLPDGTRLSYTVFSGRRWRCRSHAHTVTFEGSPCGSSRRHPACRWSRSFVSAGLASLPREPGRTWC